MQVKLRYNLLFSGLLILLLNLFIPVSPLAQTVFLLLAVLFLGIPHGALDIQLQQKMKGRTGSGRMFLLRYILFIACYAFFWLKFPLISFFVFLGITAYHFGEVDWPVFRKTYWQSAISFSSGLFWIVLILCWHMDEAALICELLVNKTIPAAIFLEFSQKIRFILVGLLACWLCIVFCFPYVFFSTRKAARVYLVQTLVLLLMNLFLPLWLFFAFYFGVWHSMLSFDLMRKAFLLPWNRRSFGWLFRKALPYTLPVWVVIALLYWLIAAAWNESSLYYIIFLVVAILTFPHLLVFTRLRMFLK